jgi:hypothetical protein
MGVGCLDDKRGKRNRLQDDVVVRGCAGGKMRDFESVVSWTCVGVLIWSIECLIVLMAGIRGARSHTTCIERTQLPRPSPL